MTLSNYQRDVLNATTLTIKNMIRERRKQTLVIPVGIITTGGIIEVDEDWRRRCENITDAEINCGDCYRWSYLVNRVIGPDAVLWSTEQRWHAFIKIDLRFYDAEHPNGVFDWRDLNREWKSREWECLSAAPFSTDDLIAYWKMSKTDVMTLNEMAEQIKLAVSPPMLTTLPLHF